ncbi:MAG: transposase, partial [Candidatus Paracaedibacter sp.]
MPYKLKDPVRHKFTKKSYNKRDWKTYEEGLRNRGDMTIWFCEDAIAAWNHCDDGKRKRGRQRQYSDLAIETSHAVRLVYKQPLRQTEG